MRSGKRFHKQFVGALFVMNENHKIIRFAMTRTCKMEETREMLSDIKESNDIGTIISDRCCQDILEIQAIFGHVFLAICGKF